MIALSSADPLTMPSSCSTQLSVLHTFAPAAHAAAARWYLVYRQLHARVGRVRWWLGFGPRSERSALRRSVTR